MTEGKQTVSGAYAKIDSHERECALRYKALEEGLGDLKQGAKWIIGLLVALMGWLAIQVWDGNKAAIAAASVRPDAVSAVTTSREVSSRVTTESVAAL